jgi:hypothetical protein
MPWKRQCTPGAVEPATHNLQVFCFEADLEQLKHFGLQDLSDVDASYVLRILRSARNFS